MMIKNKILVFATHNDYVELLKLLEGDVSIVYIDAQQNTSEIPKELNTYKELNNIGVSVLGKSVVNPHYLLVPPGSNLKPFVSTLVNGETRYNYFLAFNKTAIEFRPGGIYSKNLLIRGEFNWMSDSREARNVVKNLKKNLRNTFINVKENWLGREAFEYCEAGWHLTHDKDSPNDYDLVLD